MSRPKRRTVWLLCLAAGMSGCGDDGGGGTAAPARDAASEASSTETGDASLTTDDAGFTLPEGVACSNETCTEANDGSAAICRRETQRCVALLSQECPQVEGPYQNDDALVLAVVEGLQRRNVVELALAEIGSERTGAAGRRGTAAQQPLVMLRCNFDSMNLDSLIDRLVDRLGIPGIIAPSKPDELIAILQQAAPRGLFMLAATTSAPAITHLPDDGLVWRIAPSHALVAPALALSVAEVEARLRERGSSGELRVLVLTADQLSARGVEDACSAASLQRARGARARERGCVREHRVPAGALARRHSVARRARARSRAPRRRRHRKPGAGGHRRAARGDLDSAIVPSRVRPELERERRCAGAVAARERPRTTHPGRVHPRLGRAAYLPFKRHYEERFGPVPADGQYTYDAVYVLAYAAAAAAARGEVSGPAIANGHVQAGLARRGRRGRPGRKLGQHRASNGRAGGRRAHRSGRRAAA